jgi:hypothetical protein
VGWLRDEAGLWRNTDVDLVGEGVGSACFVGEGLGDIKVESGTRAVDEGGGWEGVAESGLTGMSPCCRCWVLIATNLDKGGS